MVTCSGEGVEICFLYTKDLPIVGCQQSNEQAQLTLSAVFLLD